MEYTWAWLIATIGLVALVLAQMNVFGGSKNRKMITWIGVIVLIFGGIVGLGFLQIASLNVPLSVGSDVSDSGAPVISGGTICPIEDTTVTLSAQDKYTSGATGGTHKYRINGAPALTVSNAGTLTASPGDQINVLWNNGSLTGYYSEVDTYTVPCRGTFTAGTDGGAKKLAQNGTLTVTIFNSPNDNAIDGGVTNQTLGAGDIKNLRMLIQGQYQRDVTHGGVLVLEYNKTTMDDVVILANGVELAKTSVPQTHSSSYSSDSVRKAYVVPAFSGNTEYSYGIMLDADDSSNPAGVGSDVLFTIYANNPFIDDKNGGAFASPAIEDEYSVATRSDAWTSTLHID